MASAKDPKAGKFQILYIGPGARPKIDSWMDTFDAQGDPTNQRELYRPLRPGEKTNYREEPDDGNQYARGGPVLPRSGGLHTKRRRR